MRLNGGQDVEILEIQLRNEHYRYKLALRDGAVDSILREVVSRIGYLEEKLKSNNIMVETPGHHNRGRISEQ